MTAVPKTFPKEHNETEQGWRLRHLNSVSDFIHSTGEWKEQTHRQTDGRETDVKELQLSASKKDIAQYP